MAGTTAATGAEQTQHQRKGTLRISLTDFDLTTVSEIAEGSGLEIAGAWVDFLANESMGAGWAGMAVGNVYARIDSVALTSEYTATAPTWNTELQGWYDATGQYKYYAKLYKDAGGNYTQKALYTEIRGIMQVYEGQALNTGANADRIIRLANDCRLKWDEANDRVDLDKGIYLSVGGLSILLGNITITSGYIVGTLTNDTTYATAKGCNGIKKVVNYIHGDVQTENDIFDALSASIPNVNDTIIIIGSFSGVPASRVKRTAANTITIYWCGTVSSGSTVLTNGGASTYDVSLAW
jgi:hypothetical protein